MKRGVAWLIVVSLVFVGVSLGRGSESSVLNADIPRPVGCDHGIAEKILRGPAFTPFHEGPRLLDRSWVNDRVRQEIADLDVTGTLDPFVSMILVAPRGCVARLVIRSGTGDARVDSVVQRWLESAEFTRPLLRGGTREMPRERAVPAWILDTLEVVVPAPVD